MYGVSLGMHIIPLEQYLSVSFRVSPSRGNTERSIVFLKNRTNENITTFYGYVFISRIIHARNQAKKNHINTMQSIFKIATNLFSRSELPCFTVTVYNPFSS
jgi:hypothetical protein